VGEVWFTIEANVAGAPSGVALATSNKILASSVSTSSHVIQFLFRRPADLAAGTTYHLVMQGDYVASNADNIGWRADTTAAVYAGGSKESYDGAVWTADADDDFWFSLRLRVTTSMALPGDYTQYCLIGYVYNNSTPDFVPFNAFDRKVSPLIEQLVASGAGSATPQLNFLYTYVPLCRVALDVIVECGTNAGDVAAGPFPDGIAQTADQHRQNGAVRFKNPAGSNTIKVELAPILTQHQAMYLSSVGGVAFSTWIGMWEWF
jgi:hypothetical protein